VIVQPGAVFVIVLLDMSGEPVAHQAEQGNTHRPFAAVVPIDQLIDLDRKLLVPGSMLRQARILCGLHESFFGRKMTPQAGCKPAQQGTGHGFPLASDHGGVELVQGSEEGCVFMVQSFNAYRVFLTPSQQGQFDSFSRVLLLSVSIGLKELNENPLSEAAQLRLRHNHAES
jgi:hypothetical protein